MIVFVWTKIKICVSQRLRLQSSSCGRGLTAAGSRFCNSPKCEFFALSFGGLHKKMHQKACCTCSTILFLHSTNQIIVLWRCRCRCRCRRHFLKRTLRNRMTKKCRATPGKHSLARHFFVILPS